MARKKRPPFAPDSDEALDYLVSDLVDLNTGWYRPWYVHLRLHEEVVRGSRYDRSTALLGLELQQPVPEDSAEQRLLFELLSLMREELRASDLPGILKPYSRFLILLPDTDRTGAEKVEWRTQKTLHRIGALTRVAMLGEDGSTPAALLDAASPTPVRRLRLVS